MLQSRGLSPETSWQTTAALNANEYLSGSCVWNHRPVGGGAARERRYSRVCGNAFFLRLAGLDVNQLHARRVDLGIA